MRSQASQASLKGSLRLGSYLKRLRQGYGYSLRRVEERARAEGGEIDNSQLSRYEKGICYPSFDKLRVLASVFNVSVQAFSDVVDLEEFEDLKPISTDVEAVRQQGRDALKGGSIGEALACYERMIDLLEELPDSQENRDLMISARASHSAALVRLGKLSLAEQELRHALREHDNISAQRKAQAIYALAKIHAEQGDLFLAEMEAEKACGYAIEAEDRLFEGRAVHSFAYILAERGNYEKAIERYQEAAAIYAECSESFEAILVRICIGDCFAEMGKVREGVRILRSALQEARQAGHQRLEAQAWSNLGVAYFRQGDLRRARGCFRESDALAHHNNQPHPDLLFFNSFYEWRMAAEEKNPTREKIAFGRLKALRSNVERRMNEVEQFDAHVERGRNHA